MASLRGSIAKRSLLLLLAIGAQEAAGFLVADVSTLAGSQTGFADGIGTLAWFDEPNAARLSPDGTFLLVVSMCCIAFVMRLFQKYSFNKKTRPTMLTMPFVESMPIPPP